VKIKEIISQSRRDFQAIYECEHCGHTFEGYGYDDRNFHEVVIPAMKCPECKKQAKSTYRPLQPKYPDSLTV